MGDGVRQADICMQTHTPQRSTHWDHIICREKQPGNIQMGSGYNSEHWHCKRHLYRGFSSAQSEGGRWGISKAAEGCIDMLLVQLCHDEMHPCAAMAFVLCATMQHLGAEGLHSHTDENPSTFSQHVGIRNATAYTTEIMCETGSSWSLFFFLLVCVNQRKYMENVQKRWICVLMSKARHTTKMSLNNHKNTLL